jgi:carboxypeptidase Taq
MPARGAEARAAALGEMAGLVHGLRTDERLRDWLDQAEAEDLDPTARANLREMRRSWRSSNALPTELVQASSIAASRCEHAWRSQRTANDWRGFAANLREVVALVRREATLLSEQLGVGRYDALLDRFEPGMTSAEVERVFGDLRGWLPDLIGRVQAKQAGDRVEAPREPFAKEAQRALCERVMRLLGFDF